LTARHSALRSTELLAGLHHYNAYSLSVWPAGLLWLNLNQNLNLWLPSEQVLPALLIGRGLSQRRTFRPLQECVLKEPFQSLHFFVDLAFSQVRKGAAGQHVNTCGVPATCGCYDQARHMQM
jgi:hypothetical protein